MVPSALPMPGVVEVWHASIAAAAVDRLTGVLTSAEQVRAMGYRFQKDRRQFIAARGLLRHLLGRYLDQPARDIPILAGRHGKPAVAGPLQFNLSHSGDALMLAFARDCRVGIDIEWIDPGVDVADIAAKFFAPAEQQALAALPIVERLPHFFQCWVRKEAFLKGTGDALMRPTDQFEVAVGSVTDTALLSVDWDPALAARWCVLDLAAPPGFQAALAVDGGAEVRRCGVPAIGVDADPSGLSRRARQD